MSHPPTPSPTPTPHPDASHAKHVVDMDVGVGMAPTSTAGVPIDLQHADIFASDSSPSCSPSQGPPPPHQTPHAPGAEREEGERVDEDDDENEEDEGATPAMSSGLRALQGYDHVADPHPHPKPQPPPPPPQEPPLPDAQPNGAAVDDPPAPPLKADVQVQELAHELLPPEAEAVEKALEPADQKPNHKACEHEPLPLPSPLVAVAHPLPSTEPHAESVLANEVEHKRLALDATPSAEPPNAEPPKTETHTATETPTAERLAADTHITSASTAACSSSTCVPDPNEDLKPLNSGECASASGDVKTSTLVELPLFPTAAAATPSVVTFATASTSASVSSGFLQRKQHASLVSAHIDDVINSIAHDTEHDIAMIPFTRKRSRSRRLRLLESASSALASTSAAASGAAAAAAATSSSSTGVVFDDDPDDPMRHVDEVIEHVVAESLNYVPDERLAHSQQSIRFGLTVPSAPSLPKRGALAARGRGGPVRRGRTRGGGHNIVGRVSKILSGAGGPPTQVRKSARPSGDAEFLEHLNEVLEAVVASGGETKPTLGRATTSTRGGHTQTQVSAASAAQPPRAHMKQQQQQPQQQQPQTQTLVTLAPNVSQNAMNTLQQMPQQTHQAMALQGVQTIQLQGEHGTQLVNIQTGFPYQYSGMQPVYQYAVVPQQLGGLIASPATTIQVQVHQQAQAGGPGAEAMAGRQQLSATSPQGAGAQQQPANEYMAQLTQIIDSILQNQQQEQQPQVLYVPQAAAQQLKKLPNAPGVGVNIAGVSQAQAQHQQLFAQAQAVGQHGATLVLNAPPIAHSQPAGAQQRFLVASQPQVHAQQQQLQQVQQVQQQQQQQQQQQWNAESLMALAGLIQHPPAN